MRILVFGATGGTGKSFTRQALDRGHDVTVFVRDPVKLGISDDRLHTVTGDMLDAASVEAAFQGEAFDAVAVIVGMYHRKPQTVVSDGTRNIVTAMQKAGCRRIGVVTSLGCGDSKGQGSFIARLFQRLSLPEVIADKERQETLVSEAGLDWTFVRPPRLLSADKVNPDLVVWQGAAPTDRKLTWATTRATVANLLLRVIEDGSYIGQGLTISDAK